METQKETERVPETDMQRESISDLLGKLTDNSAALIHDELTLAKQEIREKLSAIQSGLIIMAIGAVLSLVALITLCAAAVIALAAYVGAWQAALIIGAILALSAGITVLIGLQRLKQTSLKTEQTIQTLEEDKKWLKKLT